MGRTDDCQFDGLSWQTQHVNELSHVQLTDKWGRVSTNQVNSCGTGCVKSTLARSRGELFWTIPCDEFGGNLIKSYGASIRYVLEHDGRATESAYVCASIRGAANTYFSRCAQMPPSGRQAAIELHENTWMQSNNKPVTRERFMMLLARCKTVSIRAKFHSDAHQVQLSALQFDKASSGHAGSPVSTVEMCRCPAGYEG